ncbi:prefoldin subunit 6, related protein [Rhizoctonia solani AG-3 Rhs1AP]|uniref:Prefoldin subunit 6, related protein n=2 Tax=Rhizoctonia solani AG-3 TaxID=1086053 RepID=A0A074SPR5_9AGAM|nr:prefoldin subunit 6, related protein [Rhizoctonia solani AG-3 Rhs1AP]KEP52017.1 prefoldin subunit 6, related protein [Rhizoctonia solani 123E]
MSKQSREDLQARLEVVSKEYQKVQDDIQGAVETHQRLDSQVNENQAVKKEFASLKPHNTIYKMIGPVLVKQDPVEAKSNVDKRLEFIKGEITRVEQQISDLNTKSEKIKAEVVTIQNVMAAQQQPQAIAA